MIWHCSVILSSFPGPICQVKTFSSSYIRVDYLFIPPFHSLLYTFYLYCAATAEFSSFDHADSHCSFFSCTSTFPWLLLQHLLMLILQSTPILNRWSVFKFIDHWDCVSWGLWLWWVCAVVCSFVSSLDNPGRSHGSDLSRSTNAKQQQLLIPLDLIKFQTLNLHWSYVPVKLLQPPLLVALRAVLLLQMHTGLMLCAHISTANGC